MKAQRADVAETRMVYPVFPTDANHYNTLFGGHGMGLDGSGRICVVHPVVSSEGGHCTQQGNSTFTTRYPWEASWS